MPRPVAILPSPSSRRSSAAVYDVRVTEMSISAATDRSALTIERGKPLTSAATPPRPSYRVAVLVPDGNVPSQHPLMPPIGTNSTSR
jgi:hypothetical protein